MFVEEISCTKAVDEKEAIELSVLYFHNISFDCRGLIASSLLRFFFCIESFFMLRILSAFLMLKRDGKWQLPVIYNSSVSPRPTRRQWQHKATFGLTQTPTQAIFTRDFHYIRSVTSFDTFSVVCCLLFSPCPFHFLRTNNKNLKSKCLHGEKKSWRTVLGMATDDFDRKIILRLEILVLLVREMLFCNKTSNFDLNLGEYRIF